MPSKLNVISVGTPSLKFTAAGDGALEIQNDGNTAMTVSASGVTTFASQPVVPVPAFRAYLSADQSVTSGVITKVALDTVVFDTNSWFDTTNYRYVPQIAGYYKFDGVLKTAGTSSTSQLVYLYKNGVLASIGGVNRFATSSGVHTLLSDIVYLNGSTDYVEMFGFVTASSGTEFSYSSPSNTSFITGFLVRAA